ncbi:MAG: cytochrome C biogenesis protein [Candidatus Diapherotrites archaeon]|nr:cytochrome C biogenesis protein [Candidatus Diapherotrites archaeon]
MAEVTLVFAFIAGLVSFLSPCVLPLVPAFLTFLAGTTLDEAKENFSHARVKIFLSSVFFVLGFSIVFSVLGVLLQSVLSSVAYDVRTYLGYVGGILIIFFGLVLMGIIKIPALMGEHTFKVKSDRASYFTSFLFGAAFAAGWTPCVGAVLGGILTLAVTNPQTAFPLMVTYSLGLGVPFLLVGLFVSQSKQAINAITPHLKWLNIVFGIVLIILGILVFTNTLSLVANLGFLNDLLLK